MALSKDGASHCLYFLDAAYNDPSFTSAEDAEDPMVIMKLDTKNEFGSLDARLVLDVLSGKASRDYECGIKSGEDFETAVHELRAYFRFFKMARTCESTLRFFSYDGATNYLKLRTGGLDYKATHQNSWYIALLPFTSGDEFSRCFLNFEAWLMQTTQP